MNKLLTVKNKLIAMALVPIVVLMAISFIGVSSMKNADKHTSEMIHALEDAQKLLVTFQIQAQDFKRVLLRGSDQAQFDKYWQSFNDRSKEVEKGLDKMEAFFQKEGVTVEAIDAARLHHEEVTNKYKKAIKGYDSASSDTAFKVDAKVQGIDYQLIEDIESLVKYMEEYTASEMHAAENSLMWTMGVMVFVSAAILIALGLLVARTVAMPLTRLTQWSSELAEGKAATLTITNENDEIADLKEALEPVADKAMIQGSTMTNLRSNVIIADNEDVITFANNGTVDSLRELTEDIRQQFPNFDVEKVVGGSIHRFHKNPDRIRQIIKALSPGQVHSAKIKIGPLTLDLNAGGVFAADGERLGTYVEWRDVTEDTARQIREKEQADMKAKVEREVNNVANMINDATRDIAQGNTNLSERTEAQAASIEETTATMQQITERVNEGAANAKQALDLASSARSAADRGGDVVKDAINAMSEISESSTKISDIIGVIDEIAFQTNLLALNAAVEAARAGEQGRGFAVVASEVRTLAGRSATAAKEIKDLINESVDKVKAGTNQVNETGECLTGIISNVQQVAEMVSQISEGSQEQALSITEINKSVNQMDSFTQQNAALVEEAASASKSLEEQSSNLVSIINGENSNAMKTMAHTQEIVASDESPAQAAPKNGSANGAEVEESMPMAGDLSDDQAWMDA